MMRESCQGSKVCGFARMASWGPADPAGRQVGRMVIWGPRQGGVEHHEHTPYVDGSIGLRSDGSHGRIR